MPVLERLHRTEDCVFVFGTVGGHVVFIQAKDKDEAWEKALSSQLMGSELRYHGWLFPYLDHLNFDDIAMTL